MLLARSVAGIAVLFLWVYCLFEVIRTPPERIRNLPKVMWLIVVLLLPLIGSVLWLVVGRPKRERSLPYKGNSGIPAEYDRPGRAVARNPDDDAAFLEHLRRRAEEQRKAAEEQRRREQGDGPAPTP